MHPKFAPHPEETQPKWISRSIAAGAGMFIFALVVSAVFDPSIRFLHALQAVIYIAVIILTRRNSAWGFGAGFAIAAFWNYMNLVHSSFIAAGFRSLWLLLTTGEASRPDLLIAVAAAEGHVLMIVACMAGLIRLRPRAGDRFRFAAGGVSAIAYFVVIIVAAGPQYIGLLHRVFHV